MSSEFRWLSPPGPLYGLFLLLTLAGAAVLLDRLYRREAAPVGRALRVFLVTLRLLALSMLVLFSFRPARVAVREEARDSLAIVLLDASSSMGVKDSYADPEERRAAAAALGLADLGRAAEERLRGTPRIEIARAALSRAGEGFALDPADHLAVRVLAFSRDASLLRGEAERPDRPLAALPEAKAEGTETRIGDALASALESARGRRLAAVVLVSDGRSNAGKDPVEAARLLARRKVPLYALGAGSAHAGRNLAIRDLAVNRKAVKDDPLEFRAVLKAHGFAGRRAAVRLLEEGIEVARREVEIPQEEIAREILVEFAPKRLGVFRYVLEAAPFPEEERREDNAEERSVEVVEGKTRVLLVAGQPTWDFRYLKNLLLRDKAARVSCWLLSADPAFPQEGDPPLKALPRGIKDLLAYDVVVLLDPDPAAFGEADVEALREFVREKGGGFCFAAGPHHAGRAVGPPRFEPLLPVEFPEAGFAPAERGSGAAFVLRPTAEGLRHPILRLAAEPQENHDRWESLPGLFGAWPGRRVKPGATALAAREAEGGERETLLASQYYGLGRTLYVGFSGTWRWRYGAEQAFERFWGQALRFLKQGRTEEGERPGKIEVAKELFLLGEPVEIRARVFDPSFLPFEGAAEIRGRVEGPGGPQEIALARAEAGIFRALFVPKAVGGYRASAGPLKPGGEPLAPAAFETRLPRREMDETALDPETLSTMARITGGRYGSLAEAPAILESLRAEVEYERVEEEREIWDRGYWLFLFTLLLGLEWAVRKWKRLA